MSEINATLYVVDATGAPAEDRHGDCVFTYKDLVKRAEDNMSSDDYRYLSK